MKKNNKGFTFLEAIIAFALLGLVSLMVLGLIVSGSNTFRMVSADLSLQYESQLAMAQLSEYIIDCNGGVAFSGDTLMVISREDPAAEGEDPSYSVEFFRLDSAAGELRYSVAPVRYLPNGEPRCPRPVEEHLISGHLEAFDATVKNEKVAITLSFRLGGENYTATQTIAMRNAVVSGYDYQTVLDAVCTIPEEGE